MRRLLLACAFALSACGGGSQNEWDVRGVVVDVDPGQNQVLIEHEEIEGFMPAMTMNFDVATAGLLAGLEPGQAVSFRLHYDGKRYTITALETLGEGDAGRSGLSLDTAPTASPAPAFTLVDQDGQSLALADLRGKAVVLDFIFTHCPGPCPILTGILRDAQDRLPDELRERTHFVSITLDPERDTPDVLKSYAGKHGLDTSDWSLLTGSTEGIEIVLHRYGVAAQRNEDTDNIDHLVATFLIDPQGNIVKRYLGTQHSPDEIIQDLGRILS